jgi:hypothetical protein
MQNFKSSVISRYEKVIQRAMTVTKYLLNQIPYRSADLLYHARVHSHTFTNRQNTIHILNVHFWNQRPLGRYVNGDRPSRTFLHATQNANSISASSSSRNPWSVEWTWHGSTLRKQCTTNYQGKHIYFVADAVYKLSDPLPYYRIFCVRFRFNTSRLILPNMAWLTVTAHGQLSALTFRNRASYI